MISLLHPQRPVHPADRPLERGQPLPRAWWFVWLLVYPPVLLMGIALLARRHWAWLTHNASGWAVFMVLLGMATLVMLIFAGILLGRVAPRRGFALFQIVFIALWIVDMLFFIR